MTGWRKQQVANIAKKVKMPYDFVTGEPINLEKLEAFAELVRADEREACWNIIFEYAGRDDITLEDESLLKHLADLIKARGQA